MSDADDTRARESRVFRLDLVIAICALIISALATTASWWQSRVVAQQLSSQVWPYLAMTANVDPSSISLMISNEGLGPARLRWVVLSLDGKPRRTLTDILSVIAPEKNRKLRGQFTDVGPGTVIRVGGTVTLFRIADRGIITALVRNYKRLDVAACYCAIIPGNCWEVRKQDADAGNGDPQVVAECPDRRKYMFESGLTP